LRNSLAGDYLFGMAVKAKTYFSFQEAIDDFSRWGLVVVWGEDVATNVVTGPAGNSAADQ
jgi:hypothetical protein